MEPRRRGDDGDPAHHRVEIELDVGAVGFAGHRLHLVGGRGSAPHGLRGARTSTGRRRRGTERAGGRPPRAFPDAVRERALDVAGGEPLEDDAGHREQRREQHRRQQGEARAQGHAGSSSRRRA